MDKVRYAGLLERFHISLSDLEADTCVVASATYSSNSAAVIDRTTALRALKRAALAHPSLCVQLEGKYTKKPYFVRLPQLDLDDVLEYSTDVEKTIEEVTKAELLKPIARSTTKPLWRVIVRSDNVVLFSWHHAIADGNCTHSFHAAFLSALNTKLEANLDESTVVTVPAQLTIPPSIEQCTDISMSFKKICEALYEVIAPAAWQSVHKAWTGNRVVAKPHTDILVRMRKIEPETARRLVALCREHKCTITAFFHTLAVYVFSHLLVTTQKTTTGLKKRHKVLSTGVPISLRRFTGVPPLDICDHVSTYHTYHPIIRGIEHYPLTRESFPWTTAAEFGKSLHAFIPKSREVVGTAKFIFNTGLVKSYFLGMLGKKRSTTLVLSNVGVMPPLETSKNSLTDDVLWEIDNVCFGQNDSVLGAAMYINMAGSPSGAINISYTWGKAAMDLELAEAFIDGTDKAVRTILAK